MRAQFENGIEVIEAPANHADTETTHADGKMGG
jgi:hypothetical protein